MPFKPTVSRARVLFVLTPLIATGCAVSNAPITLEERQRTLQEDRKVVESQVEPVGAVLTMREAIARGLKHNMEHRQRLLEQAVALGTADLSNFDMLPKLLANAGYSYRNNDFRTRQLNLQTNVLNEPGVISSDREFSNTGLSLQWSALDFGISYYTAKQNADRLLLSAERRRRTMHILVQDIQSAYVRAASSQMLREEISRILREARKTLENSQKAQAEGLRSLLDSLRFQKSVLDNMRLLETVDNELSSATVELNRLINLPPGTRYQFEDLVQMKLPPDPAKLNVEELEVRALAFNAEMTQSVYETRIAAMETRKNLLRYFPNLTFNYGQQHSNNSYYINQSWAEGATQLSFNLFNLLSAPAANRFANAQKDLAEQRRMTVQMAIVSQVHLSMLQWQSALRLYHFSSEIDDLDAQLVKIIVSRQQQGAASDAERVAAETSAVVSRLRKYQSMAALFGASGRMQATVGIEPEFDSVSKMSLQQLVDRVKVSMDEWDAGALPKLPAESPSAAKGG